LLLLLLLPPIQQPLLYPRWQKGAGGAWSASELGKATHFTPADTLLLLLLHWHCCTPQVAEGCRGCLVSQ
jgi:hypothetical protein